MEIMRKIIHVWYGKLTVNEKKEKKGNSSRLPLQLLLLSCIFYTVIIVLDHSNQ